MFTEGMTAGRGFIALVATMLGQANPLGVMASSLLFGLIGSIEYSAARILAADAFHIDASLYCDAAGDVLFQRPYLCTGCTESGRKLALILNVYVRDSKRRRKFRYLHNKAERLKKSKTPAPKTGTI